MCKVLSEVSIEKKYKLLYVDEEPPLTNYERYQIGGKYYNPVNLYDMENVLAISATDDSLVGQEVVFA